MNETAKISQGLWWESKSTDQTSKNHSTVKSVSTLKIGATHCMKTKRDSKICD